MGISVNVHASESHKVVRFNYKRPAKQNYFLKAHVDVISKYYQPRGGITKHYDKKNYQDLEPLSRTIEAVSKKGAVEQYKQMPVDEINRNSGGTSEGGSDEGGVKKVNDIIIQNWLVLFPAYNMNIVRFDGELLYECSTDKTSCTKDA